MTELRFQAKLLPCSEATHHGPLCHNAILVCNKEDLLGLTQEQLNPGNLGHAPVFNLLSLCKFLD